MIKFEKYSWNGLKLPSRSWFRILPFALPETNSSHLKIGRAPKGNIMWTNHPFSGAFAVSFREGNWSHKKSPISCKVYIYTFNIPVPSPWEILPIIICQLFPVKCPSPGATTAVAWQRVLKKELHDSCAPWCFFFNCDPCKIYKICKFDTSLIHFVFLNQSYGWRDSRNLLAASILLKYIPFCSCLTCRVTHYCWWIWMFKMLWVRHDDKTLPEITSFTIERMYSQSQTTPSQRIILGEIWENRS